MSGYKFIVLLWIVYGFGALIDMTAMMLGYPFPVSPFWLASYPDSPHLWAWLSAHFFHMEFGHILSNSIYGIIGWMLMKRSLVDPHKVMIIFIILVPGLSGILGFYGLGASGITKAMVAAGVIGTARKLCPKCCYIIPLVLWVLMGDISLILIGDHHGIGVGVHLLGSVIGLIIGGLFNGRSN